MSMYVSIGWIGCPCGKEGFAYLWNGRLEVKHPLVFGTQTTFGEGYALQGAKQKTCYIKVKDRHETLSGWKRRRSGDVGLRLTINGVLELMKDMEAKGS